MQRTNTEEVGPLKASAYFRHDDVLFHWSILAMNWDNEEADALLPLIAEQWVTVRGFSFASAWMEKFKQTNKKSIQKNKKAAFK